LKIYVCNVAEEPAQTEGYTVLDHLNIIRVNRPWPDDIVLVEADVIDENYETTTARHDPD
jgi:hypothetical protein